MNEKLTERTLIFLAIGAMLVLVACKSTNPPTTTPSNLPPPVKYEQGPQTPSVGPRTFTPGVPVAPIQHNPFTVTTNDPAVTVPVTQPVSITTTNDIALEAEGLIKTRFKSNGMLNIRSFGAKGDGVADDTAALLLGFGFTATNHVPLYFPPGTYLTTSVIDMALLGDGNLQGWGIYGHGNGYWNLNGPVIKYVGSIDNTKALFSTGTNQNVIQVPMRGITFDANNKLGYCVLMPTGPSVQSNNAFEYCVFMRANRAQFFCGDSSGWTGSDWTNSPGDLDFSFNRFANCNFAGFDLTNASIGGLVINYANNAYQTLIDNCIFARGVTNWSFGVYTKNCNETLIKNCWIAPMSTNVTDAAFVLDSSGGMVTLKDNQAEEARIYRQNNAAGLWNPHVIIEGTSVNDKRFNPDGSGMWSIISSNDSAIVTLKDNEFLSWGFPGPTFWTRRAYVAGALLSDNVTMSNPSAGSPQWTNYFLLHPERCRIHYKGQAWFGGTVTTPNTMALTNGLTVSFSDSLPGSLGMIVTNSNGDNIFEIRPDGYSAFGSHPSTEAELTLLGAVPLRLSLTNTSGVYAKMAINGTNRWLFAPNGFDGLELFNNDLSTWTMQWLGTNTTAGNFTASHGGFGEGFSPAYGITAFGSTPLRLNSDSTGNLYAQFSVNGTPKWLMAPTGADGLDFYSDTQAAYVLRMLGTNVGIGRLPTRGMLDVEGDALFTKVVTSQTGFQVYTNTLKFNLKSDGSIDGPQKFNNLNASTLVQADGSQSLVSVANGTGALINNGAGAFTYTAGNTPPHPFTISDGSTNWTFAVTNGIATITHSP